MSKKIGRRSSLSATAFAVALSVLVVPFATQAEAANGWSPELSNGSQVHTHRISQARDPNNNLVDVWLDGQGSINIAYNNRRAQTWTGAVSAVAPRVVYTDFGWRVFHTGTDGHIYYAGFQVNSDQTLTLGSWQQIPGNVTTSRAPAVTALHGSHGEEWMLAYRGNDARIYTQYHTRGSGQQGQGTFNTPLPIASATSDHGPDVALNPASNGISVIWTGSNNSPNVWESHQTYGSPSWSPARSVVTAPGPNISEPAIAFTVDTRIAEIVVGSFTNGDATYYGAPERLSSDGLIAAGGSHVVINEQFETNDPPVLSPQGNQIWGIGTDPNGNAFYKNFTHDSDEL
ncbi:hypothetical protein [Streptomyces sp. NPDC004528]|uniref:hypothetical protein n=1 Tax=Streptomyces sp. NPDC004528 TaxID=3154550 RepID=UPI00339F58D4